MLADYDVFFCKYILNVALCCVTTDSISTAVCVVLYDWQKNDREPSPYRKNSWTVFTPCLAYKDAAGKKGHVSQTAKQMEYVEL